jgi:steroid delta-isomerase-like uncharacterized protein
MFTREISADSQSLLSGGGLMANVNELLEQWVATFNEARWEAALNLSADNAIEEEIGTGRTMNREESIEAAKAWKAAFPDARGQIVSRIASGNQIAGEVVWEGRHQGEMNGIPPTGRAVRIQAAVFMEEQAGKIVRVRHYIDMAGMMSQLGVTAGAGQAQPVSA